MTKTTDNKWQNTMIYELKLPIGYTIVYLVVNTITCLVIIGTNSALIHALVKLKKLKSYSYLFIFCMSISDVCIGITQLPVTFAPLLKQPQSPDTPILIAHFITFFLYNVSGGMIFIVSIDRFIHMKYLTKYSAVMTKRTARILIPANIITSLLLTAPLVMASIKKFYLYYKITLSPIYACWMILICHLYIRTYLSVRKRTAIMNLNQNTTGHLANETRIAERQLAKCTMKIISSMIICFLPSLILSSIEPFLTLRGDAREYFKFVLLWTYSLSSYNSAMNAIFVILQTKQIKNYLLNIVFTSGLPRDGNDINSQSSRVAANLVASNSNSLALLDRLGKTQKDLTPV